MTDAVASVTARWRHCSIVGCSTLLPLYQTARRHIPEARIPANLEIQTIPLQLSGTEPRALRVPPVQLPQRYQCYQCYMARGVCARAPGCRPLLESMNGRGRGGERERGSEGEERK
jgi:hypothetical protein